MWRVYGGAVAVIAGIAAFIEAHSHAPEYGHNLPAGSLILPGTPEQLLPGHLSRTQYDLLLIGAWALVILGALTIVLGLTRYWASVRK